MKLTEREVYIINKLALFGNWTDEYISDIFSLCKKGIVIMQGDELSGYLPELVDKKQFCKVKKKAFLERFWQEENKKYFEQLTYNIMKDYWRNRQPYCKMSDSNL